MRAYSFLFGANKWLDYRIILLPKVFQAQAQVDRLTYTLDRFLDSERAFASGVEHLDPELGRIIFVYEKVVALLNDTELIDRVGRKIYRVQGIIFFDLPDRFEFSGPPFDKIYQRMKIETEKSFTLFCTEKKNFTTIVSTNIADGEMYEDELHNLRIKVLEDQAKPDETPSGPSIPAGSATSRNSIPATVIFSAIILVLSFIALALLFKIKDIDRNVVNLKIEKSKLEEQIKDEETQIKVEEMRARMVMLNQQQ